VRLFASNRSGRFDRDLPAISPGLRPRARVIVAKPKAAEILYRTFRS
jgi:hypothetical protein